MKKSSRRKQNLKGKENSKYAKGKYEVVEGRGAFVPEINCTLRL